MKGFFSFIIIFFMILILLNSVFFFNNQNNNRQKIVYQLVQIEQNNKERTLLENNVDNIIRIKLNEILFSNNLNLVSAKKLMNDALYKFLKNKAFITEYNLDSGSKITLGEIDQVTKIFVDEIENIKIGQFFFTGGFFKSKNISKNFGEKFVTKFKIPVDYTIKMVIFNA